MTFQRIRLRAHQSDTISFLNTILYSFYTREESRCLHGFFKVHLSILIDTVCPSRSKFIAKMQVLHIVMFQKPAQFFHVKLRRVLAGRHTTNVNHTIDTMPTKHRKKILLRLVRVTYGKELIHIISPYNASNFL